MGAHGAHSFGFFISWTLPRKYVDKQGVYVPIHAQCWHLNTANQMGIKYMKLKGFDISDLFSFEFFFQQPSQGLCFHLRELWSLFSFPPSPRFQILEFQKL